MLFWVLFETGYFSKVIKNDSRTVDTESKKVKYLKPKVHDDQDNDQPKSDMSDQDEELFELAKRELSSESS